MEMICCSGKMDNAPLRAVNKLVLEVEEELRQDKPPKEKHNRIVSLFKEAGLRLNAVNFEDISAIDSCEHTFSDWNELRCRVQRVFDDAYEKLWTLKHVTPTIVALDDIADLVQELHNIVQRCLVRCAALSLSQRQDRRALSTLR